MGAFQAILSFLTKNNEKKAIDNSLLPKISLKYQRAKRVY